jgi:hypothetical protein
VLRDARAAISDEVPVPPRMREWMRPDQEERMDRRLDRLQTLILSRNWPTVPGSTHGW